MNKNFVKKTVEAAVDAARDEIEALAEAFRTERLLPFCKRHRLTYIAGMGMTVFYRGDRSVDSSDIAALTPLEEILNIEALGTNDCFGYYIREITERDIA